MKLKLATILAAVASATVLLLVYTENQHQRGFSLAENQQIEASFIQFIAKYGKSYASKEEVTKRFSNFVKTYEIVQMHNQRAEKTYEMEINQFADRERKVRKNEIQLGELQGFSTKRNFSKALTQVNEVDWRLSGNVSPVQDQKDCGACWAFSAISSLESAISIKDKTSQTQSLSIQYLVDCDISNQGCMGGLQYKAYQYIRDNGFFYTSDYYYTSYLNAQRKCLASQSLNKQYIQTMSTLRFDSFAAEAIMILLTFQPVAFIMNAPDCFMDYKGGVFKDTDSCQCTLVGSDRNPVINHGATMVGYSVNSQTEGCAGYWIVQNSWGVMWGEKGYFRLCIPLKVSESMSGTCNSQFLTMLPDISLIK